MVYVVRAGQGVKRFESLKSLKSLRSLKRLKRFIWFIGFMLLRSLRGVRIPFPFLRKQSPGWIPWGLNDRIGLQVAGGIF